MPKTLYIIDGHSQIYRAYYAPFGNLTAPSGEPTRATHVFSQMVLNILRDKRPDYLAVALDVSDKTVFRTEIYKEYKAQRDAPPEDLAPQFRRILSILETAGVPLLRVSGYEADDVMATLARRFAGPDLHVYFVSRDKDLDQLLSEHVSLFDPLKDEVITPQRLFEMKGWWPQQAVEAQCLIGDSVDNVPGVAGIGPKTAAKLIQKYGSAQGVIEHAAELSPKQRENVLAFAPKLELTRKLVTLCGDMDFQFDLESAVVSRQTWARVRPVFEELGFRRLVDQLPKPPEPAEDEPLSPAHAPGVTDRTPARVAQAESEARAAEGATRRPDVEANLFSAASLASEEERADAVMRTVTAPPRLSDAAERLRLPEGGDYRLVNTLETLDELARELAEVDEFALDTETTGLRPIDSDLVGLSFSWRQGRAAYVPVRCIFGGICEPDAVRERLAPLLADSAKRKVGHNLKYDLIALEQAGMPLRGPLFDTMIAAFAIDPTRLTFGLDRLVETHLGHKMIAIAELIGRGRDQLPMDQVQLAHIAEYASEDADYTWRLKQLYEPQLEPLGVEKLFYETEMPLLRVLMEMERNGVSLDLDVLKAMSRQMNARLSELTDEIHKLVGFSFNLDSTRQLGEALFDRLKLRVVKRTRTARSTDAETLEELARETGHPALKLLLEYREIQKLRSTYVDALPLEISRRTGRVHTSYSQVGAITGRLSSSDPNLQNIPIRTEMGRQIRRAFVPRSADERLIVADYSQIELRVLAHFSEDPELIRAFVEDRDIHQFVAAQVNNVALSDVTREMRARAKAVNFGIVYGQTAFGLAQTTGMSRNEAQAFIDAYFKRYARIRGFIDRCIAEARQFGYVRTILGRRRPIQNIDSRNRTAKAQAERFASNTVIQGSAADLIKTAMIKLHERITLDHLPLRMLQQVHDELVCEAPAEQAEEMAGVMRDVMMRAMELRVPLKVDVAIGRNWLESK